MTVGASSSAGAATDSPSAPSPAATRATFPQSAKPTPPAAEQKPSPPKTDPADFVFVEAVRISQTDASARSGALEMLRWTSRRRAVIEQARDRLQADAELQPETRAQALALVEQALDIGLLF
jgi:hypothetical protein